MTSSPSQAAEARETTNLPAPRNVLGETFDAVLFDLDGTLVSSIEVVERCWGQLAVEYQIPAQRFTGLHGVPARQALDILMFDREPAERAAAFDRIVALEVADTEGLEILPGVEAALRQLSDANRCAIVTSCGFELAKTRTAGVGLTVPSVVVTADDVAVGKPDPAPYLLGAARLNVSPGRCLVVEDAPAGLASGRAAGAATLAVTTSHQAEELAADLVVRDLAAVQFNVTAAGVTVELL